MNVIAYLLFKLIVKTYICKFIFKNQTCSLRNPFSKLILFSDTRGHCKRMRGRQQLNWVQLCTNDSI